MGLPRQGFQATPSKGDRSPDFSGEFNKGEPRRRALANALHALSEMMLAQRHAQTLTPENDEVTSPTDRDSPEFQHADGMKPGGQVGQPFGASQDGQEQARKANKKTRSLYGLGKSPAAPAPHSKPDGISKNTRHG